MDLRNYIMKLAIKKTPSVMLRTPAPAEKAGLIRDDSFPPKIDGTLRAEATY